MPLWKSVFEDEEITSFGEAPSHASVTVDDVRDAEQQTAEKHEKQQQEEDTQRDEIKEELETEKEAPADDSEVSADALTDTELDTASDSQLLAIRFTPHYTRAKVSLRDEWKLILQKDRAARILRSKMEYDTPSGTTAPPVPTCPSCGDAADAVALSDEIEDTEGSVKDENAADWGDDSTGEATTTIDAEMRQLSLLFKRSQTLLPDYYYGYEGYYESFRGLLYHGSHLILSAFRKIVKYSILAYRAARNGFLKAFKSWQVIARFWNKKLKGDFHKVDMERFNEEKLTIFPAARWLAAARTAIASCEFIRSASKIVMDREAKAETPQIAKIREMAEKVHITINVGKDRLDTSGFNQGRQFGTMTELNYTGQTIPACLSAFESLAVYMKDGDLDELKPATDKALEKVMKFAAEINEDKEEGKLDPNSNEFQRLTSLSVLYTTRCDFVLSTFRMVGVMFEELAGDLLKVCSKLEDCMTAKEYS